MCTSCKTFFLTLRWSKLLYLSVCWTAWKNFFWRSNTPKHKLIGQGFGGRLITHTFQDINDEVPRFRSSAYVAEIAENAQKNTPVTWLGKDNIAEVFVIIIIIIIVIIMIIIIIMNIIIIVEVFDHDLGTNGTFKLFLEGDKNIFEVTSGQQPRGRLYPLAPGDSESQHQRGELHDPGEGPGQARLWGRQEDQLHRRGPGGEVEAIIAITAEDVKDMTWRLGLTASDVMQLYQPMTSDVMLSHLILSDVC